MLKGWFDLESAVTLVVDTYPGKRPDYSKLTAAQQLIRSIMEPDHVETSDGYSPMDSTVGLSRDTWPRDTKYIEISHLDGTKLFLAPSPLGAAGKHWSASQMVDVLALPV